MTGVLYSQYESFFSLRNRPSIINEEIQTHLKEFASHCAQRWYITTRRFVSHLLHASLSTKKELRGSDLSAIERSLRDATAERVSETIQGGVKRGVDTRTRMWNDGHDGNPNFHLGAPTYHVFRGATLPPIDWACTRDSVQGSEC